MADRPPFSDAWEEVDVLVVGYGAAGAAAALSADDAGAGVLVVEKCPEPGGNSLVSSANTVYPEHANDAERFIRYLVEVCDGTTPPDVVETYVRGLLEIPAWLSTMGGELQELDDVVMGSYYIPNLTFPQLPAAEGLNLVLRQLKQTERSPQATGGARMWHLLDDELSSRGIAVRCATPVCELVVDSTTAASRWSTACTSTPGATAACPPAIRAPSLTISPAVFRPAADDHRRERRRAAAADHELAARAADVHDRRRRRRGTRTGGLADHHAGRRVPRSAAKDVRLRVM